MVQSVYLLTLGGWSRLCLELLVDTADLSRPFAALLLRAVAILQTEETNLA